MKLVFILSLMLSVSVASFSSESKKTEGFTLQAVDSVYANRVFEQFMGCGKKSNKGENQELVTACMKDYLTKKEFPFSNKYNFVFRANMKVSQLVKCETDTAELIKDLDHSDYDFFLCFTTDYIRKNKPGMVFFKKENKQLKIAKINI